jgi:hypothetical protein
MHPVTLRVTIAHGSRHVSSAERGASLAAFLCCAWERSHRGQTCNQVGYKAASLWLWLLIFLPREASFRFCAVGKPAWMAAGPVGAVFRSSKCKSGTLSGRYRSNGYAPNPNIHLQPPKPKVSCITVIHALCDRHHAENEKLSSRLILAGRRSSGKKFALIQMPISIALGFVNN